jgi:polysaccharide pyruvyl transferase WcaK-like protein
MAKRVILWGAYGAGNLGDDLLLEAALRRYDDVALIVGFGPPLVTTDVPLLLQDDFLRTASDWLDADATLVFGGGGLFWSVEHMTAMLRGAFRAKVAGAAIVIDAIGGQGAHMAPGLAAEIFSLSSKASVRDSRSIALLKKAGVDTSRVEVANDLVLSLAPPARTPRKSSSRPVVGVNWGDGRFYLEEPWRKHAMSIFNAVLDEVEADVELRYIPFVKHISSLKDDCIITAEHFRIVSRNRVTVAEFPKTALGLVDAVGECDAIVALRLHALVLAKLLGLPALALHASEESKYASFARDHGIQALNVDNHSQLVAPEIVSFIKRSIR